MESQSEAVGNSLAQELDWRDYDSDDNSDGGTNPPSVAQFGEETCGIESSEDTCLPYGMRSGDIELTDNTRRVYGLNKRL